MTKEQLSEYRSICREIEQLRQIMEQLRRDAENLRAVSMTGMPGAAKMRTDPIGAAIVRCLEASQPYAEKLDALLTKRAQIENAIAVLPQLERELMRCRYLQGLRWEDVCAQMHYSQRQIYRLHASALERLTSVRTP